MNPWLSQPLAQARIDDWLRVGEARRRVADRRRQRRSPLAAVPARPHRIRVWIGSTLIQTGERVGGAGASAAGRRGALPV